MARFETPTCVNTWYLFVTGVVCQWLVARRVWPRYGWFYLGVVLLTMRNDPHVAATLVRATTALSIVVAGASGQLETWLAFRPIQALGRISYSVYLLHAMLGWRLMRLGADLTGRTANWGLCWLALAVLLSLLAATLLYTFVEQPTVRLARRLKPGRAAAPALLAAAPLP